MNSRVCVYIVDIIIYKYKIYNHHANYTQTIGSLLLKWQASCARGFVAYIQRKKHLHFFIFESNMNAAQIVYVCIAWLVYIEQIQWRFRSEVFGRENWKKGCKLIFLNRKIVGHGRQVLSQKEYNSRVSITNPRLT